jgi:hypothetical protein
MGLGISLEGMREAIDGSRINAETFACDVAGTLVRTRPAIFWDVPAGAPSQREIEAITVYKSDWCSVEFELPQDE